MLHISAASSVTELPRLPLGIQRHLGQLLSTAYDGMSDVPGSMPDRLGDLLRRLESALGALDGGEETVFRKAFLEMVPRLHKFAMSLTKNPTQADDLVQDTLLRGWRSRSRFEAGTNLGAWLFTIMRNAFYSAHRKHAREVADRDGDHAERVATIPEQSGHLDLQDARAALDKLPAVMREALILVAVENLSYEDAAEVMCCRIGTVKSRVWRAREQLAAILGFNAADVGADCLTLSAMSGSGLKAEAG